MESSVIAPSSALPATASAGVVTAASNPAHGFRVPSMASIPRFFAKMASLGHVGTTADPVTSSIPAAAEALTTNATSLAASTAAETAANAAAAVTEAPFTLGRHVRNMGTYATSKWAIQCIIMVPILHLQSQPAVCMSVFRVD